MITQNDVALELRQGTTTKWSAPTRDMSLSTSDWNHIKIVYDSNEKKCYPYANGNLITSRVASCDFTSSYGTFGFQDWQSDINLKFKNFRVYTG